ncbi:uncharacterized protein A1O9_04353 [Exophiala aquamarina CBS 119918]|uniref:Xylanolytic transcriptional activator regulatory domain-containing protein n=1 Tax=Exophiala aquamarina CBS 119918 TaxID=1182545 RepID=A0A072PH99_9EURO|nr:uncharacterized protein A1O9_04353 [Exophiala aquamarina CBS 119918]KEF59509.1 hypothetical protein A1O9_04353 [Exophiala aquamarina CBS 119918]
MPQALDTELTKQCAAAISENGALSNRDFFREHPVPDRLHGLVFGNQQDSTTQSPISDLQPWMLQAQKTRIVLPAYICPLSDELDQDDLGFLHYKGALSLPSSVLQDRLLEKYVLYVHPFLPLLDLEDFYQPIHDGGKSSVKIPLILFQAVMFCAVPFVDLELLQGEGFDDREKAREKYFEKVRLLFDFNLELDPMTLIRTLVLMTYWYDNPEDIKGRWHWSRIALSYAYEIGLDRNSELTRFTLKQQKAKKRLWWCCYLRDRMISLNERRPSNIRDHEADIPILASEDFDTQYFCSLLRRYNARLPTLQVAIVNTMFIHLIRLCITFGRVLNRLYSPKGHRRWAYVEPKIVFVPKTSDAVVGDVMILDQELCQWNEQCCSTLRQLVDTNSEQECSIVLVHQALLNLLYQSIRSMVHRPQVCHACPEESAARLLQAFAQQRLREAAQESTVTAKRLMLEDLLELLPPIGITTLLFAGMQHMNDMCSRDESVRILATQHFRLILTCLYRLRGIYRSARHAIGLLKIVHQRKMVEPFPSEEEASYENPQPQIENREANASANINVEDGGYEEDVDHTNSGERHTFRTSHCRTSSSDPMLTGGFDTQPWEIEAGLEGVLDWYAPPQSLLSTYYEFDQLLEGTAL